ncbi:MAG: MFS transporter [Sphingomonas sp.]|uniref:MFS transporter n=1 Tax=unclassified Sphingomonas TaxID=196159 RepID=UPI002453C536|nr:MULTISPECIES: MFS transporter [unclassified Sphingomonas]MBQ1499031.1 MFS transporter [Sphingomonas sp.]MDH4745890.1 MFS transporter [Sphingomonas sp. CBMAI 2297]
MRRFVSPGRGFILLYALAYAGMFVSFMPFVMVLLPLKAAQAGGGHAVQLLSAGALGGAAVASLANILFGALSDRTRRLRGTRRPWVTVGLGVLSASYGLLLVAADPVSLLLAVTCIQIGINMMFAPIAAVMADEIPDAQKGMVAGLTGVSHPIGAMAAVLITLPGLGGDAMRYALLCLLFVALTAPFLLLAREGAALPPPPPAPQRELRRFDFILAWASRILFQVAGNGLSTYGFYYFLSVLDRDDISRTSVEANPIVATMTGSTIVAVLLTVLAGRFSDRMMRRKPFLAAGALAMAAGLGVMAFARSWGVAAAGHALALSGLSVFLAIHSALAMQLLPNPGHRGRDLGILNLTNTLPAMVAPLLALALAPEKTGYMLWLLILALGTLAGGAVSLCIRTQD